MDPITGGILAGGLTLGATILGNQQSKEMSREQMRFQERMSGTAHQREIQDLKAAGLNPILSALGSGASTPGGAMGSVNDLGAGVSAGASTALGIREQNKNNQVKDAQIENLGQSDKKMSTEMALNNASAVSVARDAELKRMQTDVIKKTLPSMLKKAKAEGDYSEINQIMGIIKSGTSSASDLMPTIHLKRKP